jgi:hypothetical protein
MNADILLCAKATETKTLGGRLCPEGISSAGLLRPLFLVLFASSRETKLLSTAPECERVLAFEKTGPLSLCAPLRPSHLNVPFSYR